MRSFLALAALQLASAAPAIQDTPKYIVVLKDQHNVDSLVKRSTLFSSLNRFRTYQHAGFNGFAAALSASQLEAVKADTHVAYVEQDGVLHTQHIPTRRSPQDDKSAVAPPASKKIVAVTQTNSTWGLARISHRKLGSTEYVYDQSSGQGTCSYVIDTGLFVEHEEFEGRATLVKNFDKVDGTDLDLMGHGTHVAGTLGSRSYGVARKTQLYGMKVCNEYGSCDLSDVIAGILETITDSKKRSCPNGVIMNISLGTPNAQWQSIKDTIRQAHAAGILVVAAAGNNAMNAIDVSPASSPHACTVGASNSTDGIASFSNWGTPLAVFAPGSDILSLGISSKTDTIEMSGTSMAAPHVAGLAAYFAGINGKTEPTALCNMIKSMAQKNTLKDEYPHRKSPNLLAFNNVDA